MDDLLKKRRALQSQLKKVVKAVEDHAIHPMDVVDVDDQLEIAGRLLDKSRDLHDAINLFCTDEEYIVHEAVFDNIDEKLSTAKKTLTRLRSSVGAPVANTSSSHPDIRLPRIDLPTFDGTLNEWMSFKDLFIASVHDSKKLSDAQRLGYLKSAVKGDAAKVIKSITITDANYDIAWKTLTQRFENERELAFSIIRRFTGQTIMSGESASGLRSIIDVSKECLNSLQNLGISIDQWDVIIVFIVLQQVDTTTRQLWEMSLTNTSLPNLQEFVEFLEQRARALASGAICKSAASIKSQLEHRSAFGSTKKTFVHHTQMITCKICSGSHPLFKCSKFIKMNTDERKSAVQVHGLCFNCLQPNHSANKCTSTNTCKTCKRRHHTMLHLDPLSEADSASPNPPKTVVINGHASQAGQGMLATAVVKVNDIFGQPQLCRVLMDGGSMGSFITESCVKRLGLKRTRACAEVVLLGESKGISQNGAVSVDIQSYFHNPEDEAMQVNMLILSKITSHLPLQRLDKTKWPHLSNLQLADPSYHKPARIDMLIGSDRFYRLLSGHQKTGPQGTPDAISSKWGWLVAGEMNTASPHILLNTAEVNLDEQLKRFWELENVPTSRSLTKQEQECEDHFSATTSRDSNGIFTVSLPFKQPKSTLGSSRDIAVRRFKSLEKRLASHPQHRHDYIEFMNEYFALGHMECITNPDADYSPHYYIPHHFIIKDSSTTTKFRAVFDASSKTSTGISLNESLMVGPTIQENLINILMRFRVHKVAFTADIAKMYRQILVEPHDRDWQRIVWRDDPTKEIVDFRLRTVTYGTTSAPFHATRVLNQLATEEEKFLPLGSKITKSDFYVDDLMSGASTIEEAIQIQDEVIELCRRGGFNLRKWSSNHTDVLSNLQPEFRETQLPISLDKDSLVKTLGLHWNAGRDIFTFKVNLPSIIPGLPITKRRLLSEMSKVFDPLGWLAPVVIRGKIMFQQLWKTGVGWDDAIPASILELWMQYRSDLPFIEDLAITRCVIPKKSSKVTLHGFSDASEAAYSAVVYLKADHEDEGPTISLIAAKTRVSPSNPISIPRLELCGAVLLTKLMKSVQQSLKLEIQAIHAWTDSTTVLDWIRSDASRWKTFVANRITEILEWGPASCWGHVSGTENPADCASRGIDASELITHPLWWTGPKWITDVSPYPNSIPIMSCSSTSAMEEKRKQIVLINTANVDFRFSFIQGFSSLTRLKRVTAYCQRFLSNCKMSTKSRKLATNISSKQLVGPLTPAELDAALNLWLKSVQSVEFRTEIECIRSRKSLPNKSRLSALNPFLDQLGMLRVGGRLRNAPITFDQKSPIILPRHHHLTQLIIKYEHLRHCHGGPQLLHGVIRRQFWILGAKDAIRHVVKKCVICTRHKAETMQQMMGDLPKARVTPTRPFVSCGIDYAGPFLVRAIPSRSKVTFKAYLALFICFSTKAIHLEVVSSLSTEAFQAALKRLVARRGLPTDIYTDCGTNFVGAARELKELSHLVNSNTFNKTVSEYLSTQGIHWHFNPPGSPHFGGLWEAGIKSVKHHLHRVIGSSRLTFEELTTVMCQIEACLNSRPLTSISSDPNEISALTPGHFLIGTSLTAIPEIDLIKEKINRLSRWQFTQQLTQHFWKRWSNEYLSRLQQRPKWLKHQTEIKIGDMVLIKEENIPPLKWRMGRVITLHPGPDSIVRVATIKTADSEVKRSIVKLCHLPIENNTTECSTFNV